VPDTRGGRRALEGASRGEPVSAHGLLGGDSVGTVSDLELYVPPEMLADLHEPRLVITPGYIGRDRRRPAPPQWGGPRQPTSRLALVVMVALVTSATVVPLTLALAPRGVSATATHPARAHESGPRTDLTRSRTRKERPARPARSHAAGSAARSTASADCDQSAVSALSPICLRRQQASQRQAARAALRASRSEERSAARAERSAAQAARSSARAARVAARQAVGPPAP
jgi:hypothetical protein